MQSIKKSQAADNKYAAQAKHKISSQTEYVIELDKLVDYKELQGGDKSEKEKKDGLCGSDSCNGTSVCRMRPDRDKDREQHSGIGNRR